MRSTSKNSNVPAPVPPVRPDNDECCHSGCEPCIFDLYELEMERYRAALVEWEKAQARQAPQERKTPGKASTS